jgi:hypothetical protein
MRWRVLAIVMVMVVDLVVVRPSRIVLRPRAMNRIAKAIKREQLVPPSVSLIMLGPPVIPGIFGFAPGRLMVFCYHVVVKTMMIIVAAVMIVVAPLVELPRMRVVLA